MEVSFRETLAAQQTHRLLATNSYNYLFVETLKKDPVQTRPCLERKRLALVSGAVTCEFVNVRAVNRKRAHRRST